MLYKPNIKQTKDYIFLFYNIIGPGFQVKILNEYY